MTTAERQAEFHALAVEANTLREQLAPLQAQVDALNEHIAAKNAELRPLVAELLEKRRPLVKIENKRAALSRSLNGKTGL